MNLLALDTGTETLSIAVCWDTPQGTRWLEHQGAGGARASTDLIPAVLALLAQAGLRLPELDAICFGCGPGSFTGLRTACSVVQGLALGAGVPVLPIDSLLAVAEDARWRTAPLAPVVQVCALLDARMDEIYAADYRYAHGHWQTLRPSRLLRPEAVAPAHDPVYDTPDGAAAATPVRLLAGNMLEVYAGRLPALQHTGAHDTAVAAPAAAPVAECAAFQPVAAWPTAAALLRLAPALWAQGLAVDAALAMPLYIRDKVAKTTAERNADKALAAPALDTP